MFYLIGLGMNKESISAEALEALEDCEIIYLEGYTVNFPYDTKELEAGLGKEIKTLKREEVENESILEESKTKNVAMLVYGDCLSATTHMQLILTCKKKNIEYRIFHNSSIITAVAETGLSLYKFGKTASMPNWKEHTNKPTSFILYVKDNLSIKAHTLLLVDIGLEIDDAVEQLKEATEKEGLELPEKIIAISKAGTEKQNIFYDSLENLKSQKIEMPFCFIVPSEMHFLEKEFLELNSPNEKS